MSQDRNYFEIWAQLELSQDSVIKIHRFFKNEYYIDPKYLVRRMHITVYYARRFMKGLEEMEHTCNHIIDTYDTKFMLMVPGGENPIEGIKPSHRKVGIRIQKKSEFRNVIDLYRKKLLKHENKQVLGERAPSTRKRNAFGARYFQPHMTILKAGSGIISNLYEVGENFRGQIYELRFNKFTISRKAPDYTLN